MKNGIKVNTKTPENVLIGYGEAGFVIYERKGREGNYHIYPQLSGEGKSKVIDVETEELIAAESKESIYRNGFSAFLGANRAKVYLVTSQ